MLQVKYMHAHYKNKKINKKCIVNLCNNKHKKKKKKKKMVVSMQMVKQDIKRYTQKYTLSFQLQLTYYPLAVYMRERERDALVSFERLSISKSLFSSAFHMGNERIGRANQHKTIVKNGLLPFIHSKKKKINTHFCLHLLQHV